MPCELCSARMTRNDIDLYYFTLQPTSYAGLIVEICLSKFFRKISLFVLNDKLVAKQRKNWSKNNSPIGATRERNTNYHQKESKINGVTREAIDSGGYDTRYWMVRIQCGPRPAKSKGRA